MTALNEMPTSEPKTAFISMTGRLARYDKQVYPEVFEKALIKLYSDYVLRNESPIGPNHYACLSTLQWRSGDKKSAVITANKGVEAAQNSSRGSEALTKVFERFAKSVTEGTMPKFSDLSEWQREVYQKKSNANLFENFQHVISKY